MYSKKNGADDFFQSDVVSAVFKNSFFRFYLPSSLAKDAAACLSDMEKGNVDTCRVLGPMLYDYLSWNEGELKEKVLRREAVAMVISRDGLPTFIIHDCHTSWIADNLVLLDSTKLYCNREA